MIHVTYLQNSRGKIMDENKLRNFKEACQISIIVFIVWFAYAFLRYNIVKGMPMESVPLFTTNKAMAMTAITLIGSACIFPSFSKQYRGYLGAFGFTFMVTHILMSIIQMGGRGYLDELDLYTWLGVLPAFFGVLTLMMILIITLTHFSEFYKDLSQNLHMVAFWFLAMHVYWLGYNSIFGGKSWFSLPPITVIALIMAFIFMIMKFINDSEEHETK